MLMLKTFIDEALPGVTVYNIDAFNNLESTTYMWTQLDGIRTKMLKIFEDHPEGVNMICYSQGSNNHNYYAINTLSDRDLLSNFYVSQAVSLAELSYKQRHSIM